VAAPFFAWVALNGGVGSYVATVAEYQADNRRFETIPPHLAHGSLQLPPSFSLDLSAPPVSFAPAPEPTRTVGVGWTDDVSTDERRVLESRYRLLNGRYLGSGRWEYDTFETSPDVIRSLLADRHVETATHVDPETGELTAPPRSSLIGRLYELAPFLRFQILPGLITAHNATPYLFYLALLIPLAALGLILRDAVARLSRAPFGNGLALPTAITVLCLLAFFGMLRVPIADRIPDALPVVAILSAWVYGEVRHRVSSDTSAWWRPRPWRLGLAGLLALTMISVLVISTLPATIVTRLRDQRGALASPGSDTGGVLPSISTVRRDWLPVDHHGASAITTYLQECLLPDDRVLLTWYAPDIPFAANRMPAGDQVFILPGFWSTARRQFTTLEHMLRQRVPVVVVRSNRYGDFRLAFDILDMHINERYRFAREFTPPNSPFQFRVFTDPAHKPTGTYAPLDLPCFS
jgi:hypothetical protein